MQAQARRISNQEAKEGKMDGVSEAKDADGDVEHEASPEELEVRKLQHRTPYARRHRH